MKLSDAMSVRRVYIIFQILIASSEVLSFKDFLNRCSFLLSVKDIARHQRIEV